MHKNTRQGLVYKTEIIVELSFVQHVQTLELLDFFQDVTWYLTLDFPLIWL